MKTAHPLRLGALIVISVVLVVALAAQSAGIALTKKAPDTAVAAFALNGLAYENIASTVFLATTEATGSTEQGARAAKKWALEAYRREPLVPKAHAILALAEGDPQKRKQILDAALALNRREPRLQAVVLQDQVINADYPAAIASLDRILRVKPSQYSELFPVLINVFSREGTIDEFAKILDGSSEWHGRFLSFAANQPSALQNLAALRSRMSFDDQVTDHILLRSLVREGDVETAFALYRRLTGPVAAETGGTWTTNHPPFDWSLSDQAGLRGQLSLNGERLEVSVRPGRGGIVAHRLIRAPAAPFSIAIDHDISSQQALQDIDLVVRCTGENEPVLKANLQRQKGGYRINSLSNDCFFIEIAIEARAWSGRSTLNEDIDAVRVIRN